MKVTTYTTATREQHAEVERFGQTIVVIPEPVEESQHDEYTQNEIRLELVGYTSPETAREAAIALCGLFHPTLALAMRVSLAGGSDATLEVSETTMDAFEIAARVLEDCPGSPEPTHKWFLSGVSTIEAHAFPHGCDIAACGLFDNRPLRSRRPASPMDVVCKECSKASNSVPRASDR